MNKKLKLYIDTSVWNFALENTRQDFILAKKFMDILKNDNYIPCISEIVKSEISNAYIKRQIELISLVGTFTPILLNTNEECLNLAAIYINELFLNDKQKNDALHIAIATVHRCNFIVSWNYKHIVRAKTILGVHSINYREGYGLIEIVSPREFIGKE